jgi:cysteine desulfuration protein SufE
MVAGEQNDDKVVFTADSDAILTKGIIAILIRTFSNQTASDFSRIRYGFYRRNRFERTFITRANGLVSMIKNIKCMLWHSTHKNNFNI